MKIVLFILFGIYPRHLEMQVYSTSVFIQSSVASPCRERPCASSRLALNKNRRTRLWLPASLYLPPTWGRLNPAFPSILGITVANQTNSGDAQHFRKNVIRPTLIYLGLHSEAAEALLIGTAIQESRLMCLRQINEPAKGFYQIEPATHRDIWENYLRHKPRLAEAIRELTSNKYTQPTDNELMHNLAYATAIARVYYLRIRKPLPDAKDTKALANYWKKYYNTHQGAGTPEQFIRGYNRYVVENRRIVKTKISCE